MNIPWWIGVGMKQRHYPIAMKKVMTGKVYTTIFPGFLVGVVHFNHLKN